MKFKSTLQKLFIASLVFLFCFPQWLDAQINISMTQVNINCFGEANGQATAQPSGGTPPYQYLWTTGSTEQTVMNLGPGFHIVSVTDAAQNLASAGVIITQPTELKVTNIGASAFCDVAPDGTATCLPYGGVPPYSYLWNTGVTSHSLTQLSGGTYTVTLTDAHNCTTTDSTVVGSLHEGLWAMTNHTSANCDNIGGSAYITIMSGTAPYQYLWSTGDTLASIAPLGAGTYTVTVSDINGCSSTHTVNVVQELALLSLTSAANCGYANGAATIFAQDGVAPYQYAWQTGDSVQTVQNLAAGPYQVTVTDVAGCVGVETVYVVSDAGTVIIGQFYDPKCSNALATFTANAPPLYPEIEWSIDNSVDQIVSGQGTDSIQIQWVALGAKRVTAMFGHDGTFCSGIDFYFNVVVCADTESPELAEINVLPNPFDAFLAVERTEGNTLEARAILTDISGKILRQQNLHDASTHLETADLPKGIYILKISTATEERAWKLVKN